MNSLLKKTYVLTQLALLLAIAAMLSMVGVMLPVAGINGLKVTFAFLPIMLAGLIFGPAAGAIVGALTDILGYLLKFHAFGPWFPGFTVSMALMGAMPVLIYRIFGGTGDRFKILRLTMAVIITSLIVTVTDTYWLQILYGKAFMVILPARILKAVVFIPIQVISLNIGLNLYKMLLSQLSSSFK